MTSSSLPKSFDLLNPDPHEWLSSGKRESLMQQIGPSLSLLRQSGLLRAVLGYWVRSMASLECEWSSEEEETCLSDLEARWLHKYNIKDAALTLADLRAKIRVSPAVLRWSRQQWGHRLESLYLQRKNQLDRASCRILRLRDKDFSFELYHRIKALETTFDQAAREFGQDPERHHGGLLPLQPLEQLPFGLGPLLHRLEPGRLSMPLRLDQGFCLVQVEKFISIPFDTNTEEILLSEQLRLWIDAVVDLLVAEL